MVGSKVMIYVIGRPGLKAQDVEEWFIMTRFCQPASLLVKCVCLTMTGNYETPDAHGQGGTDGTSNTGTNVLSLRTCIWRHWIHDTYVLHPMSCGPTGTNRQDAVHASPLDLSVSKLAHSFYNMHCCNVTRRVVEQLSIIAQLKCLLEALCDATNIYIEPYHTC